MKRCAAVLLAVCVLLSGCSSWTDGFYVSITPHMEQKKSDDQGIEWISDYDQLCAALTDMIQNGTESAVFFVQNYNQGLLNVDFTRAAAKIRSTDPIAAYALDTLDFELGVNAGQSTMVVRMTYLHQRSEILRIQKVQNTEGARTAIGAVLSKCTSDLVMYIENYQEVDLEQMAADYAQENPDVVMETPKVSVAVYPETGDSRVVEMKFTYQTSRETLREMQSSVETYFESAEGYVSGDETAYEKYNLLYIFLMQLRNYKLDTSITPAYSLLRHGVGDSRAFATVYAAMCRRVGLECLVVSGTRDGEPWIWNMVSDGLNYYHVDLHRCDQEGSYSLRTDGEMDGYVWDYSAYPVCGPQESVHLPPNDHGTSFN